MVLSTKRKRASPNRTSTANPINIANDEEDIPASTSADSAEKEATSSLLNLEKTSRDNTSTSPRTYQRNEKRRKKGPSLSRSKNSNLETGDGDPSVTEPPAGSVPDVIMFKKYHWIKLMPPY